MRTFYRVAFCYATAMIGLVAFAGIVAAIDGATEALPYLATALYCAVALAVIAHVEVRS